MDKQYQVVNGMHFDARTPLRVCQILANHCHDERRIRVFYGDRETGKCWLDEYDTIGNIGCSCGRIKIPLLIKTKRSYGGSAILDHCIVAISEHGIWLYKQDNFHFPQLTIEENGVYADGENVANFTDAVKAHRWIQFMLGKRNSK